MPENVGISTFYVLKTCKEICKDFEFLTRRWSSEGMNTKEIVQMTVAELKRNNMIRLSQTSSFQKTEKLLYIFPDIEDVDEPFLNRLRECLERLKDDEDFDLIDMKYFQKMTHEEIAEFIDVDPSTVTRRKNRIVKRLSFMLFPSDAINELLNE